MIDGIVNRELAGKTIECAMKDGTYLILRTTCGHEYRIGWTDGYGEPIKGEPFLKQVDVRVIIPGPPVRCSGGQIG